MSQLQSGHASDKPVVLGSSSKWRARILRDAGIPFIMRSPDIDEKSIRNGNPYVLTLAIAAAKAGVIADLLQDEEAGESLIITADQVAIFHGDIREKPSGRTQARRWLSQYREDCVHVVTTVVVTDAVSRASLNGHDTVTVVFGPFPDRVIDCLIGNGDVMQSCGAFVHEDPAIAPFVRCYRGDGLTGRSTPRRHGADNPDKDVLTSVSGLPLALTKRLLGQLGWGK